MNLLDSSFLCLDIGTFAVRGVGIRIVSGRIAKSAAAAFESDDTEFAIKNVIDGLERDVGVHFDTAYVTGNFGNMRFDVITARKDFCTEHKITESDIMMMVFENMSRDDDFRPMHVVPLRYDLSGFQNIATPVGQIDRTVAAVFAVISYNDEGTLRVRAVLRAAHMTADDLSDTLFLVANTARPKNESALLIDMGASHTSIGIWTRRGPVFMARIPMGQETLTDAVQSTFNLPRAVAERIKRDNLSMNATAVDGFTPASTKYDFTRAEVNDVALPALDEILDAIVSAATPAVEKYHPEKIYLFGGGAAITGIGEVFAKKLGIPVQNLGASAAVDSVAANAWKRIAPRAKKYAARRKAQSDAVFKILSWFARPFKRKNKKRFIPIMPSTLAFNMRDMATYARFKSVNISMIHVDIMDGFYVDSVAGGIDDLK
ncbi:MAG: hypothetical protein FWF34_02860, partial [Alphaproteobacteria bacterium]|nr:hypothetical protein [Alphaproteobacteria bacterium]